MKDSDMHYINFEIHNNTWKPDNMCRPEMVVKICKAFIIGSEFRPLDQESQTDYVGHPSIKSGKMNYIKALGSTYLFTADCHAEKFNMTEINTAIHILEKKGYYVWAEPSNPDFNCNRHYFCTETPFTTTTWQKNAVRVHEIEEFFD